MVIAFYGYILHRTVESEYHEVGTSEYHDYITV